MTGTSTHLPKESIKLEKMDADPTTETEYGESSRIASWQQVEFLFGKLARQGALEEIQNEIGQLELS